MDNNKRKKQVEVIINGKVYRLGTTDSEEYIKSVAEYVNRKYTEILNETSSIARMSEYFPIMLALNIADDLFKKSDEGGKSLKDKSDLENKIYKLEADIKAAEELAEDREKEAEGAKLIAEEVKTTLKIKEEEAGLLGAQLEKLKEEAEGLRLENKRLSAVILDAGLIPPVPDKNGRIKDKDKDRETLLKELNDIKSENGRTKKENKSLTEKLKNAEEEIALLKSAASPEAEPKTAKAQNKAEK